jgi:hypothetical protein
MQFKLNEEQAKVLSSCIKVHDGANKTLQTALNHHTELMIKNEEISDEQWLEIANEHGLDLNTHDWMFTTIEGVPYVVSQNRQEQTNGED